MVPADSRQGEVTVVVPYYNRSTYARRLIQSVVAQSVRPRSLVFVDNGSTVDELAALEAIIATEPLRGIAVSTLQTSKLRNANVARNLGTARADTPYVAFLDSDDWWHPNHLESSLSRLLNSGKAGVYSGSIVHSSVRYEDHSIDLDELPTPFHLLFSTKGWTAQTSTFVVNKYLLGTVRWDESLRRHQDYDFFLAVAYGTPGWAFNNKMTGNLDRIDSTTGRTFDFRSMIAFLRKWRVSFPAECLHNYLLHQMDMCLMAGGAKRYYRYYRKAYLATWKKPLSALVTSPVYRTARMKLIRTSKQLKIYPTLKRMRSGR